jgi:transcriptional regulator with XRE-family HTH domain
MEGALTQRQSEMRLLGEARRPDYVEMKLLAQCETLLQAIHLCVHLSRLPHYAIAEKLGIDRGHWTRIMQGQAHFPTNKIAALMQLCGNYAPLQWLAKATGQEIAIDQRELRRQQLRRELAELDAQAA